MAEVKIPQALQTTDRYKVATPAGWPDNELIGKNVIIPPPGSEKEIQERKGKYDCYDWWFCYKAI